jgi:hypothetical protein
MSTTALVVMLVGRALSTGIIWFGAAGVLWAVAAVTFVVVMARRALRT